LKLQEALRRGTSLVESFGKDSKLRPGLPKGLKGTRMRWETSSCGKRVTNSLVKKKYKIKKEKRKIIRREKWENDFWCKLEKKEPNGHPLIRRGSFKIFFGGRAWGVQGCTRKDLT